MYRGGACDGHDDGVVFVVVAAVVVLEGAVGDNVHGQVRYPWVCVKLSWFGGRAVD